MLRVGFVLRSTEIQPECFRFVSPTVCLCGVGVVKVFKGPRGSKAFGSPHGRLLRDPPTASAGERVARGRSRVGAPKCVGTAASGPRRTLRFFSGGTDRAAPPPPTHTPLSLSLLLEGRKAEHASVEGAPKCVGTVASGPARTLGFFRAPSRAS